MIIDLTNINILELNNQFINDFEIQSKDILGTKLNYMLYQNNSNLNIDNNFDVDFKINVEKLVNKKIKIDI